jgi:hypothetical protein
VTSAEVRALWKPRNPHALRDLRRPDGREFMRIDHDEETGFRVRAPGFGSHVVASDGSHVLSAVPLARTRRWQRLFFAPALPLAAAAAGLDVLHAGAVAVDGTVAAFAARSGAGKTSLVLQLTAAGAGFLTDDVLAVELDGKAVLAHAGAASASIDAHELRALDDEEHRRVVAARWGRLDGKTQIDVRSAAGSAPLGALFFLERSALSKLEIRRERTNLVPKLLGSAFLPYFSGRRRIEAHLEIAAAAAAGVPTYSIAVPAGMPSRVTAAGIRAFGAAEGLWAKSWTFGEVDPVGMPK